jgi:hypothetical protein
LGAATDFKITGKRQASCSGIRRLCCSAWKGCGSPDAEEAADGTVEVWAVTDCEAARACPDCGAVSDQVHETVVTRPRDVRRAGDAEADRAAPSD